MHVSDAEEKIMVELQLHGTEPFGGYAEADRRELSLAVDFIRLPLGRECGNEGFRKFTFLCSVNTLQVSRRTGVKVQHFLSMLWGFSL